MPPLADHRRARFNPEVTLGHLISAGTMIVTMIVGYATLNSRVGVIEGQMATLTALIERTIRADEQLTAIRATLDKHDDRIERLEQRGR